MNKEFEDTPILVELGTVSGDTRGNAGPHWENGGLKLYQTCISDE